MILLYVWKNPVLTKTDHLDSNQTTIKDLRLPGLFVVLLQMLNHRLLPTGGR